MIKNTGLKLEEEVYELVKKLVESDAFFISNPNVRIYKKKSYYSKDRESNIVCDITVEKYMGNPDEDPNLTPAIIVVIECKDYSGAHSIPVDDVEEFHAKLQQIGADNTKGVMITKNAAFQKGALNYAKSKRIALARILPDDQVRYLLYMITPDSLTNLRKEVMDTVRSLTEKNFVSHDGRGFFSLSGDLSLSGLITNLMK